MKTINIDEIKQLLRAGRTKNGKIKALAYRQTVLLSTSKKRMMINKDALPIKLTVPTGYMAQKRINKQAKQDLKIFQYKTLTDNHSYEVLRLLLEKNESKYFSSLAAYWAGYARGIREHRQKVKKTAQSAFDVIGANDVIELSHELGISEDKLTYAVMEVIAKRNNGGVI